MTKTDLLHNLSYKEEFEGNTEHSTAAYTEIREDASTGLTYKLPLEGGYARGLLLLDMNYPTFQEQLFSLEKIEQHALLTTLKKSNN